MLLKSKLIAALSFINLSVLALPPQYEKNHHTSQSVKGIYEDLFYEYGFRGPRAQGLVWSWNWKDSVVKRGNDFFGIPEHVMSEKTVDQSVIDQLPYYGYKLRNGFVTPDMNILVQKYRDSLFPLFKQWKQKADQLGLDGRAKVELLLNFLQDVPYGLPPERFHGRYIHGLFPPTAMFTEKYGDCDSKSLAFAGILSWDSEYKNKIAFITVPGHMLIGIAGIDRPYDHYVEYRGKKYIYAEPVGTHHSLFGRGNQEYRKIIAVEPLELDLQDSSHEIASESGTGEEQTIQCPSTSFPVDYTSSFSGIRTLTCTKNAGGKYVKHGPQLIFNKAGKVQARKVFKDDIEL